MKKKTFILLTMLLSVGIFISCNDDDDKVKEDIKKLEGDYSTTSSGSAPLLILKYSDTAMLTAGQTSFKATGGNNGIITLNNIIPGESITELDVKLEDAPYSASLNAYSFKGEHKTGERVVSYSGMIEYERMNLSLDVAMTKQNIMAGWRLDTDPIHMVWEANDPDLSAMINGVIEQYKPALTGLIYSVLHSIEFRPDGNIIADYKDVDSDITAFKKSPLNLAHYYLKDNKLYALLNLEMILGEIAKADTRDSPPAFSILQTLLTKGIPVNYKISDDIYLKLFIDKELIASIINDSDIQAIIVQAINELEGEEKEQALAALDQMSTILQATTKLEIGLNLVDVSVINRG